MQTFPAPVKNRALKRRSGGFLRSRHPAGVATADALPKPLSEKPAPLTPFRLLSHPKHPDSLTPCPAVLRKAGM